ncbi:hypothetical protein, partial [Acinetobacter baumannii]|uniref:hypothetical protein n=1 Tax=Acinetobacter baumannii TaxID=470 RepID=UPI0013CFE047
HALAPTLVLVVFYFSLNTAIGAVIERYNARLAARGPAGLVIAASRRSETGFLAGWTHGRMTRLVSIVACGAVAALL